MYWHRVMHQGFDACGPQVSLQRRARGCPDGKQMIHVTGIHLQRHSHRRTGQAAATRGRQRAPLICAAAATAGVRRIAAWISSRRLLMPAPCGGTIELSAAGCVSSGRQSGIAGHDGATVTKRAKILRRIEAEGTCGPNVPTGVPSLVARCA